MGKGKQRLYNCIVDRVFGVTSLQLCGSVLKSPFPVEVPVLIGNIRTNVLVSLSYFLYRFFYIYLFTKWPVAEAGEHTHAHTDAHARPQTHKRTHMHLWILSKKLGRSFSYTSHATFCGRLLLHVPC